MTRTMTTTKTTTGALLFALAATAFAGTPIDETIDAGGIETLDIRNVSGSVTVTGTNDGDVTVTGELSADAERLDFRRDGDRIVVHVIMPNDRNGQRNRVEDTTLEISAPRALMVEVDTVSASIDITDVTGEQDLATVSGDIDSEIGAAEVSFRTVSGRIRVTGDDAATRSEVASVSGNLDLDGVSGEVIAQTVSGGIGLASARLERADIKSVSGNIEIDAALAANGRLQAVTTSGGISLNLLGSADGRYEISTFSGRIDNCFGPSPQRPQFGPPSSNLRFSEGDSDARVELNSMSGNVRLCTE